MTQSEMNYAKVLFDLNISEECIQNTKGIICNNIELMDALSNPSVKKTEKHSVIDHIFDVEIRNFLKLLCDHDRIELIDKIFMTYDDILLEKKNYMRATLSYVTRPEEKEIDKIKEFICKKYNKTEVKLELKEDSSLIGGFILTVGDTQYDKSVLGTLSNLQKTLVRR